MTHFPADQPLPPSARGAAIALGNFDGVHAGHRAVLASAVAAAKRLGVAAGAGVFTPHPRRVFQPDAPPFRIQTDAQRARALEAAGMDHVFDVAFTTDVARMTDAEFAERILRDQLGVAHVSIGAHFHFGRGRMGNAETLARLGRALGFSVDAVGEIEASPGVKESSTLIRQAIAEGDMDAAGAMLTRPWAIEGVVQKGFQRGREFGFATANLALGEYVRPKLGIYAVRVHLANGAVHDGVASLGVNPTVGALPAPLLEAHLFDFDADLYGQTIEVAMIAYLRPEANFPSIDALKVQMAADAENARAALLKRRP